MNGWYRWGMTPAELLTTFLLLALGWPMLAICAAWGLVLNRRRARQPSPQDIVINDWRRIDAKDNHNP